MDSNHQLYIWGNLFSVKFIIAAKMSATETLCVLNVIYFIRSLEWAVSVINDDESKLIEGKNLSSCEQMNCIYIFEQTIYFESS